MKAINWITYRAICTVAALLALTSIASAGLTLNGVDQSGGGVSSGVTSTVVASLPAAGTAGRLYQVTDGATGTDCTVGSGANTVLCMDNGAAWVSVSTAGAGDLLADGTVPLTADWDVGGFEVRALTFESDVATGTAPFAVASTTTVANLTAATANAGDSATAFFAAGTIEHERGGLEADVSAYDGVVKISAGATSALTVDGTGDCGSGNVCLGDHTHSSYLTSETGDVSGAGDCTGGACLDGTSDGGTTIALYDGDSHKGTIDVPDITGDVVYTMPAATSTIALHKAYDTIWVPAGAFIPRQTNGAQAGTNEYATNDINIDYYAFDTTTEEYVDFDIVMPEDYDLGTIKAKFYWSSATGSTANDTAEWELRCGALTDSDAIDAALGMAQVITDTLLADNGGDLQVSAATPAITIGGTPADGKLVHCSASRNVAGTDDMAEDAWLFGLNIQYGIANTANAGW